MNDNSTTINEAIGDAPLGDTLPVRNRLRE